MTKKPENASNNLPSALPPNEPPEELGPLLLYYFGKLRVKFKYYWRKVVPPVKREDRADVQIQLRDASEPDFDFFVLVLLSCAIATFGLLIDSAATIIGAMLVAPLMSPILGLGLASIKGDTKLLKNAATALGRGALIAIVLSTIITWFNTLLPFVTLQDLPNEVLSRIRPSPIDLGVALAGGLAATFALVQPNLSAALPGVAIATALMPPLCVVGVGIALGRWDVAGGALLLFITNAVTIAAAAIALFFGLGFNPPRREGDGFLPRSLWISLGLMSILLIPLVYQSYIFVQDATLTRSIQEVVQEEVINLGAELSEIDQWGEIDDDTININITILVTQPLFHSVSVELQDAIAARLQKTVQLNISQVVVAKLDPLTPPTHTPTPTVGPSPSPTQTEIPITPTITPTLVPTATQTPTPTLTPTPQQAVVDRTFGEGVYLRSFPGGPEISYLPQNTIITVLYGYEIVEGWVWIEVRDQAGRTGWLPQFYTSIFEVIPPSPTVTATLER
ncbi:MAG: DUF389 domain-containing protein [Chloroflexota bacterium]